MSNQEKKVIGNITVGKPDVRPDKASHVRGVRMGNQPGAIEKEAGIKLVEKYKAVADARRSTGIRAEDREPIDPDMPHLTPA